MKTDVCIFNLNGNRAAIRDYANTIAGMDASTCNAYVMAFDKDNETLWAVWTLLKNGHIYNSWHDCKAFDI